LRPRLPGESRFEPGWFRTQACPARPSRHRSGQSIANGDVPAGHWHRCMIQCEIVAPGMSLIRQVIRPTDGVFGPWRTASCGPEGSFSHLPAVRPAILSKSSGTPRPEGARCISGSSFPGAPST
jgi:hypothetical protein